MNSISAGTARIIEHMRAKRAERGRVLIGVSGSFTAAHRCAEPELHVHRWHVTAWFDCPARVDARCQKASLDMLLAGWEGKPLPPDMEWNEDIARTVATLVNCVEVEVRRDAEGIHARWTACSSASS